MRFAIVSKLLIDPKNKPDVPLKVHQSSSGDHEDSQSSRGQV